MADRSQDLRTEGFENIVLIGSGGFGAVYRARQIDLDREVAVKVIRVSGLDDKARRRFEREQRAMGSLSRQPGIVTLYQASTTASGHPYLVMELMEGGSLADRLVTEGPLEWEQAVSYIAAVASAVDEAHAAGVLHCDIKPENILISRYGEAKLTDFGIAALAEGTVSTTTAITATVEHASPEILNGETPTPGTDVYSLASTAYTLIAGRSPFRTGDDDTMLSIVGRVATEEVPELAVPGVPNHVKAAIAAGLSKDPARRPGSASEFVSMLTGETDAPVAGAIAGTSFQPKADGATRVIPREPKPAPTPDRTTAWWKTRRALTAGCVVLLLLVGGGIAWAQLAGDAQSVNTTTAEAFGDATSSEVSTSDPGTDWATPVASIEGGATAGSTTISAGSTASVSTAPGGSSAAVPAVSTTTTPQASTSSGTSPTSLSATTTAFTTSSSTTSISTTSITVVSITTTTLCIDTIEDGTDASVSPESGALGDVFSIHVWGIAPGRTVYVHAGMWGGGWYEVLLDWVEVGCEGEVYLTYQPHSGPGTYFIKVIEENNNPIYRYFDVADSGP